MLSIHVHCKVQGGAPAALLSVVHIVCVVIGRIRANARVCSVLVVVPSSADLPGQPACIPLGLLASFAYVVAQLCAPV